MNWGEVQFDGLVGPTHHYAGLSLGNVASRHNRGKTSNPRAAALQGLAKMRLMLKLGVPQAVLPPLWRPDLAWLYKLGFRGTTQQILESAAHQDEALLACAYSAASMWAANAATLCPSVDSGDAKVHITPANLLSTPHRRLEAPQTATLLRLMFPEQNGFIHHPALPFGFADEGAANHTRLCPQGDQSGLQLFVYGRSAKSTLPKRYPARQDLEASESIVRLHGLQPQQALYLLQNSKAIDAGVFHNDVAAVGHLGWFFAHEEAFAEGAKAFAKLARAYENKFGAALRLFIVRRRHLPLAEAVKTYLFNSQLLSYGKNQLMMVCAKECKQSQRARQVLERLQAAWPELVRIEYVDLKQSMRNGGGPACLRLRVGLSTPEKKRVHPGLLLDTEKIDSLEKWVKKNYRDRLSSKDLQDAALVTEVQHALQALEPILELSGLYQKLESSAHGG